MQSSTNKRRHSEVKVRLFMQIALFIFVLTTYTAQIFALEFINLINLINLILETNKSVACPEGSKTTEIRKAVW